MNRLHWNKLNPVVTHASYIKCTPNFQWGPRTVFEHQFIYIVRGNGVGQIQDRGYPAVGPGDLFYYGPGIGHCFRADAEQPFEIITMHFELDGKLEDSGKPTLHTDIMNTLKDTGLNNAMLIGERGSEELKLTDYFAVSGIGVEELLLKMTAHFKKKNSMTAMINRGLFLHVLELLHKHTHQVIAHLSPQLKIIYHVHTRLIELAEQSYARSWIKQWTGYNEDYISRKFREQFGIAPHQFHMRQKIEKAKDLLEHTDDSITTISEKLSFNSIHYFSRMFKMHTDQTPLQYKKFKADVRV